MSGGGGFRGRGFGPRGHHRQGPSGPGCASQRGRGSRSDVPASRPNAAAGPRLDGASSRGSSYRGGTGSPHGQRPNFNPPRRPPRHPSRPDNWSQRGGSPHFSPWRGGRPPRFNGPPRPPFFRGRGQPNNFGGYRYPFMPSNIQPMVLDFPPPPEPKPTTPHLGSEEERLQKITEAADELKRKLSAVPNEPDVWNDTEDDASMDFSSDADYASSISSRGIPELKHDPPELNLTLNDLRDIGRVDHDHGSKTAKDVTENASNSSFEDSEVTILDYNPVQTMIEIDLWSDDNYIEFEEGASEGTERSKTNATIETPVESFQDSSQDPAEIYETLSSINSLGEESVSQNALASEDSRETIRNESVNEGESESRRAKEEREAKRSGAAEKNNRDELVEDSAPEEESRMGNPSREGNEASLEADENCRERRFASEKRDESRIENRESENKSSNIEESISRESFEDLRKRLNHAIESEKISGSENGALEIKNARRHRDANESLDVEIAIRRDRGREITDTMPNGRSDSPDDATLTNDRAALAREKSSIVAKKTKASVKQMSVDIGEESRFVSTPENDSEVALGQKTRGSLSGDNEKSKASQQRQADAITRKAHTSISEERLAGARREKNTHEARRDRRREDCEGRKRNEQPSEASCRSERPRSKTESRLDHQPEIEKIEVSSKIDKKIDEEKLPISDKKKICERRKLVRKMPEISVPRSRKSLTDFEPADRPIVFDPREPPPAIPYVAQSIRLTETVQESGINSQIPPAFDPRLSSRARSAMLASAPSSLPVNQDPFMAQSYQMTNFVANVGTINYAAPPPSIIGAPPSIIGAPIEPICHPLLSLPSISAAIPISAKAPMLLQPPLPIEPPPPPPPIVKSNLDMVDELEDMHEAMEFAKTFMKMTEVGEIGEDSADSDFFHMPTFPDLPPIELPPLPPPEVVPPSAIPPPLEVPPVPQPSNGPERIASPARRSVLKDDCAKETRSVKQEATVKQEPIETRCLPEEPSIVDEECIRPKVIFNVTSKTAKLSKPEAWQQQENPKNADSSQKKSSLPVSPLAREKRLANGHEDRESKQSRFNGVVNSSQRPEVAKSQSRSRSASPRREKNSKEEENSRSTPTEERNETSVKRVGKEGISKKSSESGTPESSWKSRVIGRFLKMSKNDIRNMLNNTSLRKFDIAMKHLVKERRSSLSLGVRNTEEEKSKGAVSYNQEEFMDQLSAMLDPSATVDFCNLPTQFIHHLSEVLQLDSMSDFEAALKTSEAKSSPTPGQHPAPSLRRAPRAAQPSLKEIDDRRPAAKGREKKSMSAPESSVATPAVPRKPSSRDDSVESRCAINAEVIAEETNTNRPTSGAAGPRPARRRRVRPSLETINGAAPQRNPETPNMADLDDIFAPGIARERKKLASVVTAPRNDKRPEFNHTNVNCNEVAKDSSVDRVERAAVELDKIFTAGIARFKLPSIKAARAEGNEVVDDEEEASWHREERKSHEANSARSHRTMCRLGSKADKWTRRKIHEDRDSFRNLTKEEWEDKYGGDSSYVSYEQEYRAMVAMRARRSEYETSQEAEESTGVRSRLGSEVQAEGGIYETWSDSDEVSRFRNAEEPVHYESNAYGGRSGDSSSSSSMSTSSDSSDDEHEAAPSVTKLLKVIKAKEKIAKKRSINEEIRDEVTAEIERKRRERGKVHKSRHRSRLKKSHRRRKDRKERKKKGRKRRKRKSRRSGSDSRGSSEDEDDESDEDETRSRKISRLLTENEIKKEIVIKDEPEAENRHVPVRSKSSLAIRSADESRPPSTSSSSSLPAVVTANAGPAASQPKTKAQLKQMPAIVRKVVAAGGSKESSKLDGVPVGEKEVSGKIVPAAGVSKEILRVDGLPLGEKEVTGKIVPAAGVSKEILRVDGLPLGEKEVAGKIVPAAGVSKEILRVDGLPLGEKEVTGKIVPAAGVSKEILRVDGLPLGEKEVTGKIVAAVVSKEISKEGLPVEAKEITGKIVEPAKSPLRPSSNIACHAAQIQPASSLSDESSTCPKSNSKKLDIKAYKERARQRQIRESEKLRAINDNPSALTQNLLNISLDRKKMADGVAQEDGAGPTAAATSENSAVVSTPTSNIVSTRTSPRSSVSRKTSPLVAAASPSTRKIISTSPSARKIISTSPGHRKAVSTTNAGATSSAETTKVSSPENVSQSLPGKNAPPKKLIRRRSVTSAPKLDVETTTLEARAEAGKFAHIKSEGSKEMKLREKLKKSRPRASVEGLESTIPPSKSARVRKRSSVSSGSNTDERANVSLGKSKEETTTTSEKNNEEETTVSADKNKEDRSIVASEKNKEERSIVTSEKNEERSMVASEKNKEEETKVPSEKVVAEAETVPSEKRKEEPETVLSERREEEQETAHAEKCTNERKTVLTEKSTEEQATVPLKDLAEEQVRSEDFTTEQRAVSSEGGTEEQATIPPNERTEEQGTVSSEKLTQEQGTAFSRRVSRDHEKIISERLSKEQGTVSSEKIKKEEGTVLPDKLTEERGTVSPEKFTGEQGTVSSEKLKEEQGTVSSVDQTEEQRTVVSQKSTEEQGTLSSEKFTEQGTVQPEDQTEYLTDQPSEEPALLSPEQFPEKSEILSDPAEDSAAIPSENRAEEPAMITHEEKPEVFESKPNYLNLFKKNPKSDLESKPNYHDLFKKGLRSDALPDTVPPEYFPTMHVPEKLDDILQQSDLHRLAMPITDLPGWSITPNLGNELNDSSEDPPFRGFTKDTIILRDRVLTETDGNISDGDLGTVAFEDGSDAPAGVLDLEDVTSTGVSLDAPLSYGDEEFVEGGVAIETSLLGFPVENEMNDEPEAIVSENDLARDFEKSAKSFDEESSHENMEIPRITRLNDSPAQSDFLIADVQRQESIPSPLLVSENVGEDRPGLSPRDNDELPNENAVELPVEAARIKTSLESENKEIEKSGEEASLAALPGERMDVPQSSVTPIIALECKNEILSQPESKIESGEFLEEKSCCIPESQESHSGKPSIGELEDSVAEVKEPRSSDAQIEPANEQISPPTKSVDDVVDELKTEKPPTVEECREEARSRENHRGGSKSKEHTRTKAKPNRHRNHAKKNTLTEKMVDEAIAANIVKVVPKPSSKESVLARMIEIDVEIHKLMNEKMTLYTMLQSGDFPANSDESANRSNEEASISGDREESSITDIAPPTVLASHLVRNFDKSVLMTPVIANENKKINSEINGKTKRRKKSPQRDQKNRGKELEVAETRRERKNSESKSHSRRTTSEESSRQESASTHSREKSTSSTELEDALENRRKRKTKLKDSPNRQAARRAREESKQDQGEASLENSAKSAKSETSSKPEKIKKKTKAAPEAKKIDESIKPRKAIEEKSAIVSKPLEKIGSVIYSDESTWDSLDPEAIQSDEQRGKKEGATGLALLEETFKREMAQTRKLKAVERRKNKKLELRRVILEPSALTPDDEETPLSDLCERKNAPKKDGRGGKTARGKSATSGLANDDPVRVWKHITSVIDAVASDRVEQLYAGEPSPNSDDSTSPTSYRSGNELVRERSPSVSAAESTGSETVEQLKRPKSEETASDETAQGRETDSRDSDCRHTETEEAAKVPKSKEIEDDRSESRESETSETASASERSSPTEDNKRSRDVDTSSGQSTPGIPEVESAAERNATPRPEVDIAVGKEDHGKEEVSTSVAKSSRKIESTASQEKENQPKVAEASLSENSSARKSVETNRETKLESKEKLEAKKCEAKDKLEAKEKCQAKDKLEAKEKFQAKDKLEAKEKCQAKDKLEAKEKCQAKDKLEAKEKCQAKDKLEAKEKFQAKDKLEAKEKLQANHNFLGKEKLQAKDKHHAKEKLNHDNRSIKRESATPEAAERSSKEKDHARRSSKDAEDSHLRRSSKDAEDAHMRRSSKDVEDERPRSHSRSERPTKRRSLTPRELERGKDKKNSRHEDSRDREEKPGRPKSASKRKQREKSTPPSRRSSRYSEERTKRSRSKKRERERSDSRDSNHGSEPSRKKAHRSHRSSSPKNQTSTAEDHARRRGRKRKRRPEITREEMMNCKVQLIDCKYTYLSPDMHPKVLKKFGISRINPYVAPTLVAESSSPPEVDRTETPSPPTLTKVETSKVEPPKLANPRTEILKVESSMLENSMDENSMEDSSMDGDSKVEHSKVEHSKVEHSKVADPKADTTKVETSSDTSKDAIVEKSRSPSRSPQEVDANVDEAEDRRDCDDKVVIDEAEDEDGVDETIHIVKVVESVQNQALSDQEEEASAPEIIDETSCPGETVLQDVIAVEDETTDELESKNDANDDIEVIEEKRPNKSADKASEKNQRSPESEVEEDVDYETRRTRYTVHKGPILDIKVLDDSFLAASEDGAIYRYSQTSNGILNIYKGHEAAVTCIHVLEMPAKRWNLYSGSLDGTFRCYDITTGVQERPPADVGSPVQCMDQAWGVIFVGTKSGHISRYNIKSGSIKGDRLEFSDKSVLALKASAEGPRRVLIVASRNQPITIRDALTGLFLRTICGYKSHTVYSLMRERNLVYCGTSSTSIPVFDFTNGEQVTQYNAGVGIVCMRLYQQILFAGCYDGNIYVFDTKEPRLIVSIPGPGNMLLSMEVIGDEIIAGSKNRQLHSWRMPKQVRALLSERT